MVLVWRKPALMLPPLLLLFFLLAPTSCNQTSASLSSIATSLRLTSNTSSSGQNELHKTTPGPSTQTSDKVSITPLTTPQLVKITSPIGHQQNTTVSSSSSSSVPSSGQNELAKTTQGPSPSDRPSSSPPVTSSQSTSKTSSTDYQQNTNTTPGLSTSPSVPLLVLKSPQSPSSTSFTDHQQNTNTTPWLSTSPSVPSSLRVLTSPQSPSSTSFTDYQQNTDTTPWLSTSPSVPSTLRVLTSPQSPSSTSFTDNDQFKTSPSDPKSSPRLRRDGSSADPITTLPDPTMALTTITTPDPCLEWIPGQVSDIQGQFEGDNMVFSWDPPQLESDPSCELIYDVKIPQLKFNEETGSPNLTVSFNGYKCLNVEITVTAVGPGEKYGQPKSEQLVIQSKDWTPGRVHGITGELQDKNVIFRWEHTLPNDSLDCKPTYIVDLPEQWNQSITDDTFLEVSSLNYKCLNVNITVTPVSPGSIRNGQPTTKQLVIKSTDWTLGQVRNITGKFYNKTVLLSWSRPKSDGDFSCVPTSYTVTLQQGLNSHVQHNASSLYLWVKSKEQTCLKLDITVTAVMQVGQELIHSLPDSKLLRIGSGAPGDVIKSAHESNATYIKINYTLPSTNPTCVDQYIITYQEQRPLPTRKLFVDVPSTQHYAELTPLEPCTTYQVEVKAVWNGTAWGNNNAWQISTESINPGVPNSLTTNYTDNQVEATWRPDSKGQYCVMSYHVSLLLDKEPVYSDNSIDASVTISHLFSCTIYQLLVAARGAKNNLLSDYTQADFQTLAKIPPSPFNGIVTSRESRYFEFDWTLPNLNDTSNGCELDYFRMICENNATNVTFESKIEGTLRHAEGNLSNLEPNTQYECFAQVNNSAGWSAPSNIVKVTTNEEAPDAPVDVTITKVTNSTISMSWQPPAKRLGNISNYWVQVNCTNDEIVEGCQATQRCPHNSNIYQVSGQTLLYEINALTPGTKFFIQVFGETKVGRGSPSVIVEASTLPIGASAVTNLTVAQRVLSDSVSVDLSWGEPCQLYSDLSYYQINVASHKEGMMEGGRYDEHFRTENTTHNIKDLKSEINIVVTVIAVTNNGTFHGEPAKVTFTTQAGVPPEPAEGAERSVTCTSNSSSEAFVTLDKTLFNENLGYIREWVLLIATKGNLNSTYGNIPLPPVDTWANTEAGTKGIYQATPYNWNPFDLREQNNSNLDGKSVLFTLGSDSNCAKRSEGICNGPLRPSTEYSVMVRGATAAGFRDYKPIDFRTEDSSSSAGLIVFCVLFIVLAFTVGMLLLIMKRRNTSWPRKLMVTLFGVGEEQRGSTSTTATSRRTNIVADKFSVYCSDLMADNNSGETKLTEEFRLLASLSPPSLAIQPSAYSVALIPDNRFKNRYVNILPYDETRVEISVIDNDLTSHYVNASFIRGYSGEVEYIASQGPKNETCEDFWRMVFEHDVTVIAMVTGLVEKGKEKCYQYYPNLRETSDFGYITVKNVSEVRFPIHTTRTLLVQMNTMQKTVVHLHFREWPDFGCPATTDLMLSFSQTIRQQAMENEGLVLVHCSAGVGRTGTLISMDILLQQLQEYRKVDVFNTVLKLREQRVNMVQTEGQYAYIHKCLIDAIEDPSLLSSGESTADSTEPIYQNTELIYQNLEVESSMDREMDIYPILIPDIEEVDTESAM